METGRGLSNAGWVEWAPKGHSLNWGQQSFKNIYLHFIFFGNTCLHLQQQKQILMGFFF